MNDNTLLLRHIHPAFVQQGRITSQAFRPTPKDEQRLSVYDNDQITPQSSYKHYTEKLKLDSVGVMGVSVTECKALALSVEPDPTPFPEHVLIDFSAHPKKAVETKAKQLRAKAEIRDWLYREQLACRE